MTNLSLVLTRACEENRHDIIERLPKFMVQDTIDRETIDWVLKHYEEFKGMPKKAAFSRAGKVEYWDNSGHLKDETIEYVTAEYMKYILQDNIDSAVNQELEEARDNNRTVNIEALTKQLTKFERATMKPRPKTSVKSFDFVEEMLTSRRRFYTGFSGIDNDLHISPGTVNGFVGKPKRYKSVLLGSLAWKAAMEGNRVLFVTIEMTPIEIYRRLYAEILEINPNEFLTDDRLKLAQFKKEIDEIMEEVDGDIVIPKHGMSTINEIIKWAEDENADLLFIDGIYLLTGSDGKDISGNWKEFSSVLKKLKRFSRGEEWTDESNEKQIPVIYSTQYGRADDKEEDMDASKIGYSKAIAEDSDLLIGIAQHPNDEINDRILVVMENRHGAKGAMHHTVLDWDSMKWRDPILRKRIMVAGELVDMMEQEEGEVE